MSGEQLQEIDRLERDLYYTIASEVFQQFPGYVRGVVIARDVSNGDSPDELVALLREAEDSLRSRLNVEALAEHPRIASWRDAFRSFGARPSEFRSSIEAMARRVLRGQHLPSISRLVDIGNIVSLSHIMPVGGHDVGVMAGDIALRPAAGGEEFVPLGSDEMERPVHGEIIFVEDNTVLTRRWVWRQAVHTATTPSTRHIEINVDGLPPVPASELEDACREVIDMVQRFCGGDSSYELLSQDKSRIRLTDR